jgi:phosphoglycolate phosphatase
VKHELNHNIQDIKPIPGIESILNQIILMDYQLGIVSSNSEENIRKFLQKHQWHNLFEIICCGTTIFGKAQVLNKLLRTQTLAAEEVIYVGDETRDIDAAKMVNIKVIAVTWGFNSRSILAEHDPDFLIDRPEEILQVLSRL